MTQNRYTPPGADLRTGADSPPLGTGDFDLGVCLSDAWAATWANFPLWLGAILLMVVASGVATVTVIGIFLVLPVLAWGMTRFFLRMYDRNAEIGDIFAGFSCYGTALGTMLLFFLVSFAISLPAQVIIAIGAASESSLIGFLGQVVNLAVSFLVTPRLWFTPLLVVERGMSTMDAVRYSWQATDGVKWKLMALILVAGLVGLAGFIALIIGLIPAVVIIYLMIVSAYRQVLGPAPRAA